MEQSANSDMDFRLVIAGRDAVTTERMPVINPATGVAFADCPECSEELLNDAVAAAEKAFPAWAADPAARRAAMLRCAEVLKDAKDILATTLVKEQGKPFDQAVTEVTGAAHWFTVTSRLSLDPEILTDDDKARVELHRRPIGVVAGITPWNFPLILAVWKIAPALWAGNTMILKPSPFTPLSSLLMGQCLQKALPPGVLNVVTGGNALGQWISEHPAIRKISFTGSVTTGKKIMAAAAPELKRVTLELGGNDPAIVLKDCDPAKVASKVFWGAFRNSGQICVAIKRLYVQNEIYDAVRRELIALAQSVKVGDGLTPGTQLGPINNEPQFQRVSALVADAKRAGARIDAGGHRIGNAGYFFAPTIVSGVTDETALVAEEQFGPALPILPFKTVDEVLDRANRSHFGLGGSIWTTDLDRGRDLAGHLKCGTGWVNQHGALGPAYPFGGLKWSGVGYENGPWGLAAFTEMQVINMAKL